MSVKIEKSIGLRPPKNKDTLKKSLHRREFLKISAISLLLAPDIINSYILTAPPTIDNANEKTKKILDNVKNIISSIEKSRYIVNINKIIFLKNNQKLEFKNINFPVLIPSRTGDLVGGDVIKDGELISFSIYTISKNVYLNDNFELEVPFEIMYTDLKSDSPEPEQIIKSYKIIIDVKIYNKDNWWKEGNYNIIPTDINGKKIKEDSYLDINFKQKTN